METSPSNEEEVAGTAISLCKKQLKNNMKFVKQCFVHRDQVVQNGGNKQEKPNSGFLSGERFQVPVQGKQRLSLASSGGKETKDTELMVYEVEMVVFYQEPKPEGYVELSVSPLNLQPRTDYLVFMGKSRQ